MMKSILRAVKSVFGGGRKRKPQSPRYTFNRVRLSLEELEPRDCPAVFTVTGLGDAGVGMANAGDLRYCITQANVDAGADTIQFQQGLTGEIDPATSYEITHDVTVTGPGADKIQIRGANANDVTRNPRLVIVDSGVTCTISGLTFERGYAAAMLGRNGGAIENQGGNLTVTNCSFGYNEAVDSGGAIYNGPQGSVTASGCKFYQNIAAGGDGGAINSAGTTVSVTGSSFTKNSTGGQGGAIYLFAGTLSVMDCQITENTATMFGGGICLEAGTTATIGSGTDFGKNTAQLGGGIFTRGARSGVTTINVTNTTFHENTGTTDGGGIYMDGPTIATFDQSDTFTSDVSPIGTGSGISYKLGDSSILGSNPVLVGDSVFARP